MISSHYPQITDELLSAYIDDAVTEDEKAIIEAALVNEPEIAWRLETLRYTINLLNSLPAVALPRSFALSEIQVATLIGANTTRPLPAVAPTSRHVGVTRQPAWRVKVGLNRLGQSWRNFWQMGNLFLRNAAAVSLAIFLVLVASKGFVARTTFPVAKMNMPSSARSTTVTSGAPRADAQSVAPTEIAPTPPSATATIGNGQAQSVAQQPTANQTESKTAQDASASKPVVTLTGARTNAPLAADASSTESAEVSGASAPAVAAASSTTNSEDIGATQHRPGSDDSVLGNDGFVPSPPATNGPEMPQGQAVAKIQSAAPEIPASEAQSVTSSSVMQTPAAPQDTAVLTQTITPTMTDSATVSTTYNTQSNAVANATSLEPTFTPSLENTPSPQKTPPLEKTVVVNREGGQEVAASPPNGSILRSSWLPIAQLVSACLTLILGVLWWRSWGPRYRASRQQR